MLVGLVLPVFAAMTGCSDRQLAADTEGTSPVKFRFRTSAMTGDASEDSRINDVTACRFEDGMLMEILRLQPPDASGICSFETERMSGILHVIANASFLEAAGDLEPGKTTLADFLRMEASADEMTADGLTMTGKTVLGKTAGTVTDVQMTRSVARLDISSEEKDVFVHRVIVHGLHDGGPVNPQDSDESGDDVQVSGAGKTAGMTVPAGGTEHVTDFSDSPLHNSRRTLVYVPEQEGVAVSVEVTAAFGGALHRLTAELPAKIRRNTVYTLSVHGNGAGISVSVIDGDWQSGDSSDSSPSLKGLVDVDNSVFGDGVRVNATRDTVFVGHLENDFVLSLLAEPSAEVTVDGKVRGVEISFMPSGGKTLVPAAAVSVRSALRMPGRGAERIHLDVREGNVHSGRVVLVFGANPVKIDGILRFDDEGICDFGRYVEGELAVISLPEGRELSLEFAGGENAWMKADEVSGGKDVRNAGSGKSYRLLGGWKPNDPEADGRVQEGILVISDPDGSDRETYAVRRLNWGLPVVKMGETWWCRYNLRGNVRDFEDQITNGMDPAPDGGLYEMLATLSEDELLELMGDQYQAGNHDGLPLSHDGTAFFHEGMKSQAMNFGLLDPAEMAPEGYRIPDYDDYAFFSASDNFNIGGIGERSFNNMSGRRINVRIAEREVNFLGHEYGILSFYDFEHEGNHWTLFGLGHQWNTDPGKIAVKTLLLATYGNSGRTWVMEGYASSDRPGQNWIKFAENNSVKTRMIRCVKTPVEYIYE